MLQSFRWITRLAPIKLSLSLGMGILLSTSVGLACYGVTLNSIEEDARARFTSIARGMHYTISGRLKSYTDLLRGTASLFQTNDVVDRDEFHRYVRGLSMESEFPGVEAVNFARFVTDAERPAFEERMRKELAAKSMGYPMEFKISPPGHRPSYTIVDYIEPIRPWTVRFGIDLQARASVARALAAARDSGLPSGSGTPVPLKSTNSGLGMRMPVYRVDMPLDTVEQRRAAYLGSVGIGFSVERLVGDILDDMPGNHLRLVLTGLSPVEKKDGSLGPDRRIRLFDSAAGKPGMKTMLKLRDEDLFQLAMPIGFSHRNWEITFSVAKSDLYSDVDLYGPFMAMLAGSLSTALLYALFQTLSSSRRRAIGLAKEMTRELRESEARLQQSNETLRRLAEHAESIKEIERKRIAREIHDDLGQNLLALRIEADLLAARTEKHHPRLHARVCMTRAQIDAIIKSVRQIINDLRPNVLDLGLHAAVDWQIMDFRRRTGIACELMENSQDMPVDDRSATALFRILQESLTNVLRHAHASRVRVELRVDPGWVSMSVIDNGVGLPEAGRNKPGSFGLVGVEERVKILNGVFSASSTPGKGTTIRVSIPSFNAGISAPSIDDGEIEEQAFPALM
jgi:signal transduction histidine kinase/CHASE1-domain containing sensor protein